MKNSQREQPAFPQWESEHTHRQPPLLTNSHAAADKVGVPRLKAAIKVNKLAYPPWLGSKRTTNLSPRTQRARSRLNCRTQPCHFLSHSHLPSLLLLNGSEFDPEVHFFPTWWQGRLPWPQMLPIPEKRMSLFHELWLSLGKAPEGLGLGHMPLLSNPGDDVVLGCPDWSQARQLVELVEMSWNTMESTLSEPYRPTVNEGEFTKERANSPKKPKVPPTFKCLLKFNLLFRSEIEEAEMFSSLKKFQANWGDTLNTHRTALYVTKRFSKLQEIKYMIWGSVKTGRAHRSLTKEV